MTFKDPDCIQIPNHFIDDIAPKLTNDELRVMLYIIRYRFGFKKSIFQLTSEHISKKTGLPESNVEDALVSLINKEMVIKNLEIVNNKVNRSYSLVEEAKS